MESDWRIEEFTVSEEQAHFDMMRATFSFSSRGRFTPPGTYRRLMRGLTVVMSDTPDELRDLSEFNRRASGRILINGLGLGCAIKMALKKDSVTSVDVIEIDLKLINLIEPLLNTGDHRLNIIHANGLTWRAPINMRWNVVWHDIWDNICADNLPEMRLLHRRYGGRCDWQGSWCRRECEMQVDRNGSW